MEIFNELKKINQYIGSDTNKFNEHYAYLITEYPSAKEKKIIDDYIESSLHSFTIDIRKGVNEVGLKMQQVEVSLLENIV